MGVTLNTKTSIVDYLKSQGKDSSMSARKELAKELGIENYSGTGSQNKQMLNMLKSQASSGSSNTTNTSNKTNTSNTTNTSTSNKTNTNVAGSTPVTAPTGTDQSLTDTINSSYTKSDDVTSAESVAGTYRDKVNELANTTDIISQETWDALNSQWNGGSSAYQDAMAYTNQLLEQLSSGRTSYTDQIKDMMDKIMNRDAFEYDVSTDTLFQQSLASAMASGQTAMQDTIGQASALTGGYASTYATSAGNQAYNAYIQDAYNNLPEYYQMAMEAYQMEGQDMYNQLAMLNEADATEYQRLYNSWNANFTNAQNMYNQEYSAWQDRINNAYNSANLQLNEFGQVFDQTYSAYTASQNYANNLYAQEYQSWQDTVNNAVSMRDAQMTDYWNQQDQNNFISTNDLNGDGKVDNKDIELQRQWDKEDTYIKNNDSNGDGKVDDEDNTATLKEPSETQMQKALEAYNEGGEEGLERYIASLGSSIDVDMLIDYAIQYGKAPIGSQIKDGIEGVGSWLGTLFGDITENNKIEINETKDPATLPTWEEIQEERRKKGLKNSIFATAK